MTATINKCIIPVAGLGKRWQPITSLYPKELLPIGNIPLLAYILYECVNAGISEVILVVSEEKKAFFEKFIDLIQTSDYFKPLALDSLVFNTIIQQPLNGKLGLGAAVYSAKDCFLNDHHATHFALLLPDVLLTSGNYLKQMRDSLLAKQSNSNLIALSQVDANQVSSYGIAKFHTDKDLIENEKLIEKPSANQAPSNWAVLGRYLLSVKVFDCLENSTAGAGGEVQITDAINQLIDCNQTIIGSLYHQQLFDCGKVTGFIDANQHFNPAFFLNH